MEVTGLLKSRFTHVALFLSVQILRLGTYTTQRAMLRFSPSGRDLMPLVGVNPKTGRTPTPLLTNNTAFPPLEPCDSALEDLRRVIARAMLHASEKVVISYLGELILSRLSLPAQSIDGLLLEKLSCAMFARYSSMHPELESHASFNS